MDIGTAIKRLRKERVPQLNQAEFASCIGITQAYLSQIERGHKKPSLEVIEKIAKDFEVPLPIMFWFGVEESDINPAKREYFNFLKPSIDKMIDSLF